MTGPKGRGRPLLVQEPRPAAWRQSPLFDCNNLYLPTIHLHGLTDPLSNETMGKRGHIGDRSTTGMPRPRQRSGTSGGDRRREES
jgi:hypothetical protein